MQCIACVLWGLRCKMSIGGRVKIVFFPFSILLVYLVGAFLVINKTSFIRKRNVCLISAAFLPGMSAFYC